MPGNPTAPGAAQKSDKEILGYSRYVVLAAALLAMAVISTYA